VAILLIDKMEGVRRGLAVARPMFTINKKKLNLK